MQTSYLIRPLSLSDQTNYSNICTPSYSGKQKKVIDYEIIIAELHQSREIFECKQHRCLPSVHAVRFSTQLSDISGNAIRLLSSKTI